MKFSKSKAFLIIVTILLSFTACTFDIDTNTSSPTVSTLDATDITNTTMVVWGEVTDDGNDEINEIGFCYNTTGTPRIGDGTKVVCTSDSSLFSAEITGLEKGVLYYVAAYTTNDAGTGYGETKEVKTVAYTMGSFTDQRDGNIYKTVTIGTQVWMTENLAYLPSVNTETQLSTTTAYYYVLGYSGKNTEEAKQTENYKNLGVLYNWTAALTAAPSGWKLPSKADWEVLCQFIGDDNGGYDKSNTTWYEVGTHLKKAGPWGSGTNDYGFSAIPSNSVDEFGFNSDGINCFMWSSTQKVGYSAYAPLVQRSSTGLYFIDWNKQNGYSVRLIKE